MAKTKKEEKIIDLNMIHNLAHSQKTLMDMQDEFKKDYGTYDVNITNGAINYKDEQTDKKN